MSKKQKFIEGVKVATQGVAIACVILGGVAAFMVAAVTAAEYGPAGIALLLLAMVMVFGLLEIFLEP